MSETEKQTIPLLTEPGDDRIELVVRWRGMEYARMSVPNSGLYTVDTVQAVLVGGRDSSKMLLRESLVIDRVEAIARYVEGDGTDAQRSALADGIRSGYPKVAFPKNPWRSNPAGDLNGETCYAMEEQLGEKIRIGRRAWLAVHEHTPDIVDFACFDFAHGPASPATQPEHNMEWYSMVFHGSGPSGGLRECRHIWWGDDGYTYYLNFALVEQAFAALRRWFDGD